MSAFLILFLATPSVAHAGVSCNSLTDCYSCAASCHWCPSAQTCHSAFFANLIDPCLIHGTDIKSQAKCSDQPDPSPATINSTSNSTFAKDVLEKLLNKLGITDINLTTCISDVSNSEVRFRDFALDLKSKKYKSAVEQLGRSISALATSVSSCGISEVTTKLDTLAAAVTWANISTKSLDSGVKVLVGASDLWKDLEAVAKAFEAKDTSSIGTTLDTLLSDWTSIEGGCKSGQVCEVIDGLLKVLAATAKEVDPCKEALEPAVQDFIAGGKFFRAQNYTNATASFAAGLSLLATATSSDSCGLKTIADTIGDTSSKLAAALVKIEDSKEVKILVGSANVYNELYTMSLHLENKDYSGAGVQVGLLLAQLKSSSCTTKMCIVVEGLLGSLQVGLTDLEACSADLDATWTKMQAFLSSLESKQWKQALLDLGGVMGNLSKDISACGVSDLGSVLEDTATALGKDSLAAEIATSVQFLVNGADVTSDIQKIILDATSGQWSTLGSDLGTLSTWITSTTCNSFVCKLMEGILTEADMVLTDLEPCEDNLRTAETDFVTGASLWGQKNHKGALTYWASGLNQIAKAASSCGLSSQLSYLEQEANVLGLGNVTAFDKAISILVHGTDVYSDLQAAWTAFSTQDYRTAGTELSTAVSSLYEWTSGHLCTSDACYIFSGVMQYWSDLSSDMTSCKSDFEDMQHDIQNAFRLIIAQNNKTHVSGFSQNKTAIAEGVNDIGKAMDQLQNGISNCQVQDLVDILAALATKLGASPEITVSEDILKILIEGIPIEKEISSALEDYAAKNWPGVGYNLIKLVKSLLTSASRQQTAYAIVI